jgi:cobalt/nickel transport system permease protein
MTLNLDQPRCYQSLLGRLDARWRLAALVLAALCVALLNEFSPALTGLFLAIALAALCRIPWGWLGRRLGALTLFILVFVGWLPWLQPEGGQSLRVGPLSLSAPGVMLALTILCKSLTLVTLIVILNVSAPLETTLQAATSLRVPRLLTHLILLVHRYLFLFGDEFGRMRIALRVRGYRNQMNLHTYRTVGHITGALLIRGYERAERVSQAMRCRGFSGQFHSLSDFKTRPVDVLGFLVIAASAAGLSVWDFFSLST